MIEVKTTCYVTFFKADRLLKPPQNLSAMVSHNVINAAGTMPRKKVWEKLNFETKFETRVVRFACTDGTKSEALTSSV